uniref:Uncharacterized protein n=1 Tax=Lotus japonicus TaxID=34305 RepID=I3SHS9_LOTJA|nr:unknown [Lotus japonicus]
MRRTTYPEVCPSICCLGHQHWDGSKLFQT